MNALTRRVRRNRQVDPRVTHTPSRRRCAHPWARNNEGGYATVMVLGLILLLSAVGLMLLKSAYSYQNDTRNGRAFAVARQNVSSGIGDALAALNSGRAGWAAQNVSTNGFNWVLDPAAQTITTTGTSGGKNQVVAYPARARYAVTQDSSGGTYAYGIAPAGPLSGNAYAQGVWSAAVAAGSNSLFAGTVAGQAETYGGTLRLNASPTHAISYADDGVIANATGTALPFTRSQFSGFLDTRQIDQRTQGPDCSPLDRDFDPITGDLIYLEDLDTTLSGGGAVYRCLTETARIDGLSLTGGGIKTLVATGNVRIRGNITSSSDTELHIYAGGNVFFEKTGAEATGTQRTLSNVYIWAPQTRCLFDSGSNSASVRLVLTGSLACQEIQLPAPGTGGHAATAAQVQGAPARSGIDTARLVYFSEQSGFRDNRTP